MAQTKNPTELLELLRSSASAKRRSAARQIGSDGLKSAGPQLLEAYVREREDPRTWETQLAMIRALGLVGVREATPYVGEICKKNLAHDMITDGAATCYVRLRRKSLVDARPVLELIKNGGHSVVAGAFYALGCDRMVPPEKEITKILSVAGPLRHIKGYSDPRYGVAVAAAGWSGEAVERFLKECMASKDEGVVYAAERALKKKYIRCR